MFSTDSIKRKHNPEKYARKVPRGKERYMAGTVIEYLKKYGDIPFCEKPLNDVDSLAYASFLI